MKRFKCIIIEDEPLARERVEGFISKTPFLELIGSFEDPMSAFDTINREQIDLLFLDINLGEMSGIQFIESINFTGQVIITTAYPEHALKGFELDVMDYLLKPFHYDRFLKAAQRLDTNPVQKKEKDFVFIKTENRLEKVSISEVFFIEGMGDYRRIHCERKKIMTLQTFTELTTILPQNKIIRVHKSYMVALEKIESIERNRIRIGTELIPISDSYREPFMTLINS